MVSEIWAIIGWNYVEQAYLLSIVKVLTCLAECVKVGETFLIAEQRILQIFDLHLSHDDGSVGQLVPRRSKMKRRASKSKSC